MKKRIDWFSMWMLHARIDPAHWRHLVDRADESGRAEPGALPEDIIELLRDGRFLMRDGEALWLNPSYSGRGGPEVLDQWNQEYIRRARELLRRKLHREGAQP